VSDLRAPERRDASMSLLTEVMRNPLDPGYAAAARQRERSPDPTPRRRLPNVALTTVVAVLIGALSAAAIVDLRLPGGDAHSLLVEEISTRTSQADDTALRVEELRGEVTGLQEQALAQDGAGVLELSRRLDTQSGAAAVSGPGVVVTLDDAPGNRAPLGSDPRNRQQEGERVVDYDVQIAVNGLWEAGAEAIAVNGQRLTSLAAIRSAGGAILVGFRPLERPYRIQAIGDPGALQAGLARSSAGGYLAFVQERYGLRVATTRADSLDLPGAGSMKLRYARLGGPPADATMAPEVDE